MGGIDKDKWDKSLSEHFSLEVKVMGKIAAFGDIDGEYLDRLYVHKDFQGLGYGKIILIHSKSKLYSQDLKGFGHVRL